MKVKKRPYPTGKKAEKPTTTTSRRHHNTIEKALLSIFSNARYAKARITKGGVAYHPEEGPLTEDLLSKHLAGDIVLGSYALTKADTVWWLGWDVDAQDLSIARDYAEKIIHRIQGVPHVVEFSGGKGYHILIFLSKQMSAAEAKQVAEFVRDEEGLPRSGKNHVEAYPKQDSLSPSNPMGNLLKIPLGQHPITHEKSMFVDPKNGWEVGGPLEPLELLSLRVKPEEVLKLLEGGKVDAIEALAKVLAPAWVSGERHTLALSLAGYLANLGWGMAQVEDLISFTCVLAGDDEISNRMSAVKDTFRKHSEGKQVAGYMYLAETLPGGIMKSLTDFARMVATPPVMKRLEGIRLAKGPNFQKVRETSDVIWAHLNETGAILRTRTDSLFWFESETKLLLPLETDRWEAHIHKQYGPNPAESFGRQVLKSISLRSLADGTLVRVHRGSYWDGKELYVHLGGPEVYILDGDSIREDWNGDCGAIFQTKEIQRPIHPDFNTDISAWTFLTNDLSFLRTEEASATPEEQRELLRAWILGTFFSQLMETKPILVALGAAGSGKTSTMRRILRVLEGPFADVIALSEDKPDSIRASVENHKIMVLDNLERTRAQWLVNMLNILSTGATIELRQLFKTNETYRIEPEVYVALTAVNIPFSEDTLHSRLLPIEMAPIEVIIPESVLQKRIADNREGIWASLLKMLNEGVRNIKSTKIVKAPVQSRLADFTVFCERIVGTEGVSFLDEEALRRGIGNLVDRQRSQMLESSPVIELLEEILNTEPELLDKWMTYGELSGELLQLANRKRINLRTTTAASLKRHLMPRWTALAQLWGAEKKEEWSKKGRAVEFVRFRPPDTLEVSKVRREG